MTIGMEDTTLRFFTRDKTHVTEQILKRYYPCRNMTLCLGFVANSKCVADSDTSFTSSFNFLTVFSIEISQLVWVANSTITWNKNLKMLQDSMQHARFIRSLLRHHLKWLCKRWIPSIRLAEQKKIRNNQFQGFPLLSRLNIMLMYLMESGLIHVWSNAVLPKKSIVSKCGAICTDLHMYLKRKWLFSSICSWTWKLVERLHSI